MSDSYQVFTSSRIKLSLLPTQEPHVNFLNESCNKGYFYIDGSDTGQGKSFSNSYLAMLRDLKLCVVCPAMVTDNWEKIFYTYSIDFLTKTDNYLDPFIISYNMFAGTVNNPPSHGYVVMSENGEYFVTKKFKDAADKGILLLLDEAHSIKYSNNSFYKSLEPCIKYIYEKYTEDPNYPSKVAVLSATLINRARQLENFLKIFSVIRGPIYNRTKEVKLPEGIEQLHEFGMRVNPAQAGIIEQDNFVINGLDPHSESFVVKRGYIYLKDYFVQVLKGVIMHSMTKNSKLTINNLFLTLHEKNQREFETNINQMKSLTNYNDETEDVHKVSSGIVEFGKAMERNQLIKAEELIPVIEYLLKRPYYENDDVKRTSVEKFPKILLYARYKSILSLWADKLIKKGKKQKFSTVMRIDGDVKQKDRNDIIDKFQEPNSDIRVLIISTGVGSTGINLDDTSEGGLYPRFMFYMPDYYVIEMIQVFGRVDRIKTTSPSYCFLIYANYVSDKEGATNPEQNMITSISNSGSIINELHNSATDISEDIDDTGIVVDTDDTKEDIDGFIEEVNKKLNLSKLKSIKLPLNSKLEIPGYSTIKERYPVIPVMLTSSTNEFTGRVENMSNKPRELPPPKQPQNPYMAFSPQTSSSQLFSSQQSSLSSQQSSSQLNRPSLSSQQSSSQLNRPSLSSQQFLSQLNRPSLSSPQQPPQLTRQPLSSPQPPQLNRQPLSSPQQPPQLTRQPLSSPQQPPQLTRQPLNSPQQPPQLNRQPLTSPQQPSDLLRQPLSSPQQPPQLIRQHLNSPQQPPQLTRQPLSSPQQPPQLIRQPLNSPQQPPQLTRQPSQSPQLNTQTILQNQQSNIQQQQTVPVTYYQQQTSQFTQNRDLIQPNRSPQLTQPNQPPQLVRPHQSPQLVRPNQSPSQYNQQQYNQPQYNQQYNQSQYNQSQYNQSQYNQSQYNQSQYNQSQYNQSPQNRGLVQPNQLPQLVRPSQSPQLVRPNQSPQYYALTQPSQTAKLVRPQ